MSHRFKVVVACALSAYTLGANAQLFSPGTPGCESCKADEYLLRITDTVPAGGNYVHVDDPACGNAAEVNQQVGAIIAGAPKAAEGKKGAGEIKAVANALGVQGGTLGKLFADYADTNKPVAIQSAQRCRKAR